MRVLQAGAEPDLAEEPPGAQRLRQVGMEHLERDRPIMPEVVRQEHRGHTAASELTLDPVAVGQGRLKVIRLRQGDSASSQRAT
jgi:hypothetical protein